MNQPVFISNATITEVSKVENTISGFIEIEQVFAQTLGRGMHSLAVTASHSGAGCTLLASALAKRFASNGQRTLLVDMNLQHPSLDSRYQLTRYDWSPDKTESVEMFRDVEPNINVLTATLNSTVGFRDVKRLTETIHYWQSEMDAIIFDTSPLNAINRQNIPAELVCAAAEGCLMVIKAGSTTEADLLTGKAKLLRHNANLMGCVVNDVANPRLANELIREVNRFQGRFPRLSAWLSKKITRNHFLNMPV